MNLGCGSGIAIDINLTPITGCGDGCRQVVGFRRAASEGGGLALSAVCVGARAVSSTRTGHIRTKRCQ